MDVAIGAAAGALGTYLMDQATTAFYEREPEGVQKRENAARGEKTAYESAAEKAAQLAGLELNDEDRKAVGQAIHWSLGITAGVAYGALRHALPRAPIGSGLAFGALFWLAMDEGALTLLGLTPPPKEFPWQTHARGLVGHLVLGMVLEGTVAGSSLLVPR